MCSWPRAQGCRLCCAIARLEELVERLGIDKHAWSCLSTCLPMWRLSWPLETRPPPPACPPMPLRHPAAGVPFTHAAFVHCETTSGLLNDAAALGAAAAAAGAAVIIDAMSSFGAVPLDPVASHADFIVSSANKCLQGVPGFSYIVAKRAALEACKGRARSLSMDVHAQWVGLESKDGQFRCGFVVGNVGGCLGGRG